MYNLFQQTSSKWMKYSKYEVKEAADGAKYIMPSPKATPTVYDPLEDAEALVVDALNVGMSQMGRKGESAVHAALMGFVCKYGLLGFMSALPTTPNFMEYEAAYLPKNPFIKAECMKVEEYASQFFPFEKPEIEKREKTIVFQQENDGKLTMPAVTFRDKPQAMIMSFEWDYAEPYDWLLLQFKDWAFTFLSSMLYYEDFDKLDESTKNVYRLGMSAFGGIAPTYHIELLDKPTIVWDFYSLLLGIQTMFGFTLTDKAKPLRMCRHCERMFIARHPNAAFCSPQCKNQHNVYKSRAKKAEGEKSA